MAVSLMKPRVPIAHRLDHDLESVCYVLLHLMRFSSGPVGTRLGGTRKSRRVSWWHHERSLTVMRDTKVIDLKKIIKHPHRYFSDYWRPVAPYIGQILKLFPTKATSATEADMNTIYMKFRELLVSARDHCIGTISETPFNYAAFGPGPEPAQPTPGSLKRSRPQAGLDEDLPKSKRQFSLAGDEFQVQSSILIDSNAVEPSLGGGLAAQSESSVVSMTSTLD